MHNYAYFEFSGIFTIFLGPTPTTSKRNYDPKCFSFRSRFYNTTHHTNKHYTSLKYNYRERFQIIFLKPVVYLEYFLKT